MTYIRFSDEDLTPIVKYGHERPDLDYKMPVNWDEWPNSDKASLIRDMMALANSDVPGYIVIGATDEGGVVRSYDGSSDSQIESFDPKGLSNAGQPFVIDAILGGAPGAVTEEVTETINRVASGPWLGNPE
jgi:hypothetical protein